MTLDEKKERKETILHGSPLDVEHSFFNWGKGIAIELGGCTGESALRIAHQMASGTMYILEAELSNYQILCENIKVMDFPKTTVVIPLHLAIGEISGPGTINISHYKDSHSVTCKSDWPNNKQKVDIISWNDLMDVLQLTRVDIMFCDVEGAEVGMLNGMTKVFPKFVAIEAHDHPDMKSSDGTPICTSKTVKKLMEEKGYRLLYEYNKLGRHYFPALLFERDDTLVKKQEELKTMDCPLCKCISEEILAENKNFIVVRTKKMKGHKERIMVLLRCHADKMLRDMEIEAENLLIETGKKLFSYTTFFLIMDPTYATIRDHWHLVASDLDRNAEDYEQVLVTKWRKVVSTNDDN